MTSPLLLSLGLGCGWIFSTESLMIVGNSAGNLGWLVLPGLLGTGLLLLLNSTATHHVTRSNSLANEVLLLKTTIGTLPTVSVAFASSFPLLIFAATGLLVTAGYTFNEVFLYWFPNLGFAFLLLLGLTICQLLPTWLLVRVQLLFIGLAALGILILGLYGTFTMEETVTSIFRRSGLPSISVLSSALLLVLFVGPPIVQEKEFGKVSILLLAILLPWILASLAYVPAEHLANSTIPFMVAARKIMGETGRKIMGAVVIAGSCAAVTSLFLLCRQKLKVLAHEALLPAFAGRAGERWFFAPGAAVIIAACMATGLAGDELLETLLRSALLLWLASYCLVSIIAGWSRFSVTAQLPLAGRFPALLLTIGCGTALCYSSQPLQLLGYGLSILMASGCLSLLLGIINHRQKEKS